MAHLGSGPDLWGPAGGRRRCPAGQPACAGACEHGPGRGAGGRAAGASTLALLSPPPIAGPRCGVWRAAAPARAAARPAGLARPGRLAAGHGALARGGPRLGRRRSRTRIECCQCGGAARGVPRGRVTGRCVALAWAPRASVPPPSTRAPFLQTGVPAAARVRRAASCPGPRPKPWGPCAPPWLPQSPPAPLSSTAGAGPRQQQRLRGGACCCRRMPLLRTGGSPAAAAPVPPPSAHSAAAAAAAAAGQCETAAAPGLGQQQQRRVVARAGGRAGITSTQSTARWLRLLQTSAGTWPPLPPRRLPPLPRLRPRTARRMSLR